MTVKEFVDGYKKFNNKEQYIEKHVLKDKYIPYVEKITRCKTIVDSTMYTEIGGKTMFMQNTPNQYMIYSMTLIDLYTDIDVDFSGTNIIDDFDELETNHIVSKLISLLDSYEINTWNKLLSMIIDDELENNRSIISVIDNKVTAAFELFDGIYNEIKNNPSILENIKING